ncbi:MAG: DUF4912 domain-containing protein [Polyangiaceae bacterium]
MDRKELEKLSRAELVEKAEAAGVTRPRTLTIPELIDEILLAAERSTGQKKPRGWFGRARDLLTSVVDRGLSTDPRKAPSRSMPAAPPPLPTVTLAEIYAAQGHLERAIATLDEVIARDAAHDEARRLRERFAEQLRRQRPSRPPAASGVTAAALTPELAKPKEKEERAEERPAAPALTPAALTPEIQPQVASSSAEAPAPSPAEEEPALAPPEPIAELSDRYDVDEVVAIAVDPHTVYVYWEVRAATLAPLRNDQPDGALSLRVLTVPAAGGASSDARDVRVDAAIGELFVRDLPANAEIRVAIGWLAGGAFHPVAVGLELATPREAPASEVAVQFGRMATGGIGEPYDALRAGGLVGGRAAPRFPDLPLEDAPFDRARAPGGLGPMAFEERDFSEPIERIERTAEAGDVAFVTRVETFRLGASELLTRETLERHARPGGGFLGASDMNLGRTVKPRPGDVSFARRPG